MGGNDKFTSIRKGLLEFLILKIVSADKVYVADMLDRLSKTNSRPRKARSTPCSASSAAMAWWTTNGRNPKRGRRASTTSSRPKGNRSSRN